MDMLAVLTQLFSSAQAVGVQGVFQFDFGQDNAVWAAVTDTLDVQPGRHAAADVTIRVGAQEFAGIVQGTRDVEDLFASGQLQIDGHMGLATLLPQVIHAARQGTAVEKPPARINQRYPAPERESDRISAAQPVLQSIERRSFSRLSVADFRRDYLAHGTPVILTDALREWPLFTMSREDASVYFAGLKGITRHGDYAQKAFSTDRDFRSSCIAGFIASLERPLAPDEAPSYMGNNVVPPQLLELIRFPEYFDRSLYIKPRIWIGPKGTLTPLHRDDSDNMFAQVWGQKSFILAAPHHRQALGTWSTSERGGLEGCEVNPDQPDYEQYPAARDVAFYRIVLETGDLLFLPEGWFHQVESVSTSLSVNFWVNSWRIQSQEKLPDSNHPPTCT